MNWQELKAPPIKEAIFDLRFSSESKLLVEDIEQFCKNIENDFTNTLPIFLFKIEGNASINSSQISHNNVKIGFKLSRENDSSIFQITNDGFTFSKLSPYSNWEDLKNNAFKYLNLLLKYFPNIQFQKIALRYINEFNLDIKLGESINESLLIVPAYSDQLPRELESYFTQLVIPDKNLGLKCIIHFAMQPLQNEKFKILLDIDVIKEQNYSAESIETLKNEFQNLRELKNKVFFNSLTIKVINNFK